MSCGDYTYIVLNSLLFICRSQSLSAVQLCEFVIMGGGQSLTLDQRPEIVQMCLTVYQEQYINVGTARSAIDTYKRDTSELLKKFRDYEFSIHALDNSIFCLYIDAYKEIHEPTFLKMIEYIFSKHRNVIQLKIYIVDLHKNLADLRDQDSTFHIKT